MERILVLVDNKGLQRATMEFACYLANLTDSRVSGVLLHTEKLSRAQEPASYSKLHSSDHKEAARSAREQIQNDDETRAAFKRFCDNHQPGKEPEMVDAYTLEDVLIQTRFADLILINADTGATSETENLPSRVAAALLREAECPVLVAPLTFKEINQIVFTYDGSESAVCAIKQFTHLFRQLKELPVTFLEVKDDYKEKIDFRESITSYLHDHYKYVTSLVLKGRPEDELFSYFLEKKDVLIVMGSFGRKMFSSIFHRSTADLLLRTTSLPIFISHK